jgi:hypothetical protein
LRYLTVATRLDGAYIRLYYIHIEGFLVIPSEKFYLLSDNIGVLAALEKILAKRH